MPTPGDQGQTRSCVGWAVAYLKHYQEWMEAGGRNPDPARPAGALAFSPSYIYSAVNLGRNRGADVGSDICCALELVEKSGAALWRHMPFDPRDVLSTAPRAAAASAGRYKMQAWRRVWEMGKPVDPRPVRAFLAKRQPVIIAVAVDEGFQRATRRPGYVYRSFEGGKADLHAMVVVGYDDARRAFRVINSWGTEWGDGGYLWISYDFFPRAVVEAYVTWDQDNLLAVTPRDKTKVELRNQSRPDTRREPQPAPLVAQTAAVGIRDARHGVSFDARPDLGSGVRFSGTVTVPPGRAARQAQVIVHFNYDAGGGRAGEIVAAAWPGSSFECQGGAAAAVSWQVPAEGFTGDWAVTAPYAALSVPRGTSNLVAVPMLIVDGVTVTAGSPIRLYVTR